MATDLLKRAATSSPSFAERTQAGLTKASQPVHHPLFISAIHLSFDDL
jgi:hypothetical protein